METTAQFSELVKGVEAEFADVFDENEYSYDPFIKGYMKDGKMAKPEIEIFEIETTENAEDHFTSVTGIGDLQPTANDGKIAYQSRQMGYRKDVVQGWFTGGIQVEHKLMHFKGYKDKLSEMKTLTTAAQRSKDKIAFLGILGAHGTTSFGAGDGVSLGNASHPRRDGGANQSNLVSSAYSENTQEDARKKLLAFYDNKGNLVTATGQKLVLVVPTDLQKTAEIVNHGELRSGTGNNDINIYDGNVIVLSTALLGALSTYTFENGVTISGSNSKTYLIDPGTFKGRVRIGKNPNFESTVDFDNKAYKASIDMFMGVGATDWRGLVVLGN